MKTTTQNKLFVHLSTQDSAMKIKNLVRLAEQQPVSVQLFYKLATEHSIDFKKVCKFLIRLEKLRRILK